MSLLLNNKRRKTQQASSDPYWNNVVLFLKGDGTNGSTNIVDSSPSPKTISVFGNTQISTTQSKYGGSSLIFDGSNDALTIPYDSDLAILTGNFTVEAWVYPLNTTGTQTFIAQWSQSQVGYGGIVFAYTSTAIQLYIGAITEGNFSLIGNQTVTTNSWNHIALTRNSNNYLLFKNGTQIGSISSSSNKTLTAVPFSIGNYYNFSFQLGAINWLNGYVDSLRITKGIARYTANFNTETDTYLNM